MQSQSGGRLTQPRGYIRAGLARIGVAFLVVGLGLGIYSVFIETNRLVVHRERLQLPAWHGPRLRIAALSDLHVGSLYMDRAKMRAVVELINAEQPDLVVFLGDYVTRGTPAVVAQWVDAATEFKRLRPRYGAYAVLGNHDWWHGTQEIRSALEQAGVRVLENEAVLLPDLHVYLWGLADLWERHVDYSGPLRSVPADAPVIALSHNPDVFPEIDARVVLTLAGHTHGGQVRLPWGRPQVPSKYGEKYAAGHVSENGRHLFVTTGLGTSVFPIRFGVPPEVAVLDIEGAKHE
jgi:predicted MPP superfamily phosphohydrolase